MKGNFKTKVYFYTMTCTVCIVCFYSCTSDPSNNDNSDLIIAEYSPRTYEVELPSHFPPLESPLDNPLTHDGVNLGRHLFYDPILSADSSMSCASCHLPEFNFTDNLKTSVGIDGISGSRNAMSLINIGFVKSGLFWDGRSKTLEEQALLPVEDPIELHNSWPNVIEKLKNHDKYPALFRKAFGIEKKGEITKELAAKAIAQFERIIISKDSKYDKVAQGLDIFTDKELIGFNIFFDTDPDLPDAECGHCHNIPLATSDDFFNNGISEANSLADFVDVGRGAVTKSIADNGKFRATTLRNITHTAPYMHDGRFATLDEVLDHYMSGGKRSPNADPLLHPLHLNSFQLSSLKDFILTFEDTTYYKNPELQNPFN